MTISAIWLAEHQEEDLPIKILFHQSPCFPETFWGPCPSCI